MPRTSRQARAPAAQSKEREIYRKVSLRMWGDEKYRRLSAPQPCGQALWWFLFAGPFSSRIPGIVLGGRMAMAEKLGWSADAFDDAFAEVMREGMAEANWDVQLVWLPNGIKHNEPESVNVVKAWRHYWQFVPECALRDEAIRSLKAYLDGMHDAFGHAFADGMPVAMTDTRAVNKSKNIEQEQALDGAQKPPDLRVGSSIGEAFERACGTVMSDSDRRQIRERLDAGVPAVRIVEAFDSMIGARSDPNPPRSIFAVALAKVRDTPPERPIPKWSSASPRAKVVDPAIDRLMADLDPQPRDDGESPAALPRAK